MTTRFALGFVAGVLAVALVAASADAQEKGQKGRGRRGFGFGGGTGLITLAGDEAVQKEIGADEAVVGKIRSLSEEYRTAMREQMSGIGGGNFQNLSDEERQQLFTKMREASTKVNEKFEPKLKEALTADQFKRLQEISVQAAGVDALTDARVAKELTLTDEQSKRIADIRADYQQKRRGLFGPDAGDEARAKLRELGQEETKAASEVLTKEQQDKLAALKGKEFDVSQLRTGFGGGRPGAGAGNRPGGDRPGAKRTKRPPQEN